MRTRIPWPRWGRIRPPAWRRYILPSPPQVGHYWPLPQGAAVSRSLRRRGTRRCPGTSAAGTGLSAWWSRRRTQGAGPCARAASARPRRSSPPSVPWTAAAIPRPGKYRRSYWSRTLLCRCRKPESVPWKGSNLPRPLLTP